MTSASSIIEIFHADSLAGPMKAMKTAFESGNPGVRVNLVSGRSQELGGNDTQREFLRCVRPLLACGRRKGAYGAKSRKHAKMGASWSVIFSANEMVVVTGKGNPLNIGCMADLAKPGIRFSRVTGGKDMATQRTIEFVTNVLTREGKPELAAGLIAGTVANPEKPHTVTETIRDIVTGKADAGIVYYSAAVDAKGDVDVCVFRPS